MRDVGDIVEVKRDCCSSSPRCKRCPIVWKHLAKDGVVVKISKRRFVVVTPLGSSRLQRARRTRSR